MTNNRSDVRIIGLAGRDDRAEMEAFVERHDLGGITHLVDDDGSLWARFGVTSQPSWVFVDDSGGFDTRFGILGESGITAAMDQLSAT